MAIDYTALKTEIALGAYSVPMSKGDDIGVAALLNAVNQAINIDRGLIAASEITAAILPADFLALTSAQQALCNFYAAAGYIDSANTNVRQFFSSVFAGKTSLTNLQALVSRKGSRAEQMFGAGAVIVPDDIARAKATP